jgi:hypothetical protein
VCKPDGIIAVRDSDYAGFTWWPRVPELDAWVRLYREVAHGNRAEPDADLDRIAAGWRTWGESADAWFVVLHGELICSPERSA